MTDGWASWVVLLGTPAVAAWLWRGRGWAPVVAALLLLALGWEAGRFDGLPRLTEKMDVTGFAWARAVIDRGIAGAAGMVLAGPVGRAVARIHGKGLWDGFSAGLACVGLPSIGLVLSSRMLLSGFAGGITAQSVAPLRAAIGPSSILLLGTACAGALATAWCARKLG